ncbi:PREDICTED: uncharacterized protein LOC109189776 [Ipomoea nil]|uniref:uncharacterized protein LOC109189776 n=1 Tax=Ipomoea nil TaxID=35883 RepID=UPI000900D1E4|nr:PREDICTED: uncharacterized protein LOC109189776 [Ipomoea nil]XP_019195941.1 PREDICTED: uncharacterized protein LOC109189776 [Ipomoea nil]XP_019195942.1 PREDICTED: uncharacterized protein LOC109189776 [Ipomoea nil]XP_019195943.1 PREDICTED: uncharacterized protein LOC109189776 [Ipomoea nil]XP_019195944.1 PREDICTED: uncharacterized protein LOC109189776 [Ipomoea nil]
MELEFDKYCVVDGSPTTVLPAPRHCPKVDKRTLRGKPKHGREVLCINEDFTEINFHRYRSISCKDVPSRITYSEGNNKVLKRGSVYQSSKERFQRTGNGEERAKIEFSRGSVTGFSFGIVDVLCSSDEDSSRVEENRSSSMSMNSDLSTGSSKKPNADFFSLPFHPIPEIGATPDGFAEISSNSDHRENRNNHNAVSQSARDSKVSAGLPKSLSAKLALPHSPARSENDFSRASSPKARFSPVKRMFDPFGKSKSHRSPLGNPVDFSNMAQHLSYGSQPVKNETCNSLLQGSPAHLQGFLKLERKNGAPFFEFSLPFPEDVIVAETWKVDNTLNWVYAFRSLHNRKKSSVNRYGSKDSTKESSLVGQMQISCYFCTELKDARVCDNSIVMEFVLYDTSHPRKNGSSHESSCSSPDVSKGLPGVNIESNEVPKTKTKKKSKNAHGTGYFDSSAPHPLAPEELHPGLEMAAMVIELPFEKRESLKYTSRDNKYNQPLPDLLDFSFDEKKIKGACNNLSPVKINAVIPSGNHSLPTTESQGPYPLLDRWRLGGGCDCGGWDMACPLNVFGNKNTQIDDDYPLMSNRRPIKLFVQGKKDETPALTMTLTEDGQYAVNFHAQLSALQAFSICVSVLHTMEASAAVGHDEKGKSSEQSSPRMFAEDDFRSLIEAVRQQEKQKVGKKVPYFVLNPPFSPIARV